MCGAVLYHGVLSCIILCFVSLRFVVVFCVALCRVVLCCVVACSCCVVVSLFCVCELFLTYESVSLRLSALFCDFVFVL